LVDVIIRCLALGAVLVGLSSCGDDRAVTLPATSGLPTCSEVFADGAASPGTDTVMCRDAAGGTSAVLIGSYDYGDCSVHFTDYGWWVNDGAVRAGTVPPGKAC
jgi:hypothetical protein